MAFTENEKAIGMQQAEEERNRMCDNILNRYKKEKERLAAIEKEKDLIYWKRKEDEYFRNLNKEIKAKKLCNKKTQKNKQYELLY